MKSELRIAMLGMIEGNGHPYSWSGIINGYSPTEMAKCPYAGIPIYMGKQPLESVRIPGARVTHIWTDDPADAPKVAAASLIKNIVAKPEDVIGHVDAVVIATDDGTDHAVHSLSSRPACQSLLISRGRRRSRSCSSSSIGIAQAKRSSPRAGCVTRRR